MFRALLELPLRHGLPLLEPLRASQWRPEDRRDLALFEELLGEAPEAGTTGATRSGPPGLLETWLEDGRRGSLNELAELELLSRLNSLPPPEAITVVGALAAKPVRSEAVRAALSDSPHWLVRLAACIAGVCGAPPEPGAAGQASGDPNHWVRELAAPAALLALWPARSTPADVEALAATPPELRSGAGGRARRVLSTLLRHHNTGAVVVPIELEEGEFAPVLEEMEEIP